MITILVLFLWSKMGDTGEVCALEVILFFLSVALAVIQDTGIIAILFNLAKRLEEK